LRQWEIEFASGVQSVSESTSPVVGPLGMRPPSSMLDSRRACAEGIGIVREIETVRTLAGIAVGCSCT